MKLRNLIASIALSISVVGNAQADVIAGWDFSQYFGDGLLSIDGATFTDTLNANYSNLDPTLNLGTESALLGTMYINGQFGSTDVPEGTGSEEIIPSQVFGSLASNLDAPVQQVGDNAFDSHNELQSEGQQFAEFLAMTAAEVGSIVFQADPVADGQNWIFTFGGRTFSGTASVGVEFSTDGSSYALVSTENLTTVDTRFEITLPAGAAGSVFVRMNLDPSSGQPFIDNVAIEGNVVANALNKQAGKCLNGLNKNYNGVFKAATKEAEKCVKDASGGKSLAPAANALECLGADRKGKIQTFKNKNEDPAKGSNAKFCTCADPNKCEIPAFGYQADVPGANDAVIAAAVGLQTDLLGNAADLGVFDKTTEKNESKCQQTVQKDLNKLSQTIFKEFVACKKEITKVGGGKASKLPAGANNPATGASDLVECVGFDSKGQVDPSKGKIVKAAAKLASDVQKQCLDKGVTLGGVFGAGNCGSQGNATDFANCAAGLAVNRVDQAISAADSF